MAKAPFGGADMRPRVHVRLLGDEPQVASIGCGPWRPVSDIIEGIDLIAGEGAYLQPAVIIWEGRVDHA